MSFVIRRFKSIFSKNRVADSSAEGAENDGGEPKNFLSSWKMTGISVAALLTYLGLGVLFYSLTEDWGVVDSIYFSVVTFTTVGYGDFSPTRSGTKVFTIFFIFIGIALIGFALGLLANQMLDRQAALLKKLRKKKTVKEENKEKFKWFTPGVKKMIASFMTTIFFLFLGAVVFSIIEDESFVDSLYWSAVTLTTVGYGDFSPTRTSTKMLAAFFFLPVGILVVGAALTSFADLFVEYHNNKLCSAILDKDLNLKSIIQMDSSGDGVVDKTEFVEHILVKMGKCTWNEINAAKERFHRLDKDGSGVLDKKDIELEYEGDELEMGDQTAP